MTRLELFHGNIMSLDEGPVMRYDRIYVGAACSPPVKDRLLRLLTPGTPKAAGGMLIGPMVRALGLGRGKPIRHSSSV